MEPTAVSASVLRHANDGSNLAPYPPPPTSSIRGNLSNVSVLFNTRAPITNPSCTIASATPNSPLTYMSGAVSYPRPGLRIVKASIIHLTFLSPGRFFLYPKPDDCTLISVTNPLPSNNAVAVAPIPAPVTKTFGGSAHGSPGLSTGMSIIPPLSSVMTLLVSTIGTLNCWNTVDGSSPIPLSKSLKLSSVVMRTLANALVPVILNVNLSSSSTVVSSRIPTVTFASLS